MTNKAFLKKQIDVSMILNSEYHYKKITQVQVLCDNQIMYDIRIDYKAEVTTT